MTKFEAITVTAKGAVVFITLNRPEKHNAINLEMMRELRAAIDCAQADSSINVLVLGAAVQVLVAGL